jgi:lysophospholipase L1-like esterase
MGRGLAAAGVVALALLVGGCGSTARAKPASIVALGDSVPSGTNCDCTPYPQLTGEHFGETVANDAVGGFTTTNVLKQVDSNADVIEHLRGAHIVEVEIGANDVAYSKSCGTSVDCYAPEIPTIEKNLPAIVHRVHELAGPSALVVLLDYWSVWLGGQYAAAKGDAYVNAAEEMTDRVNAVIRSTAADTGSAYVDLRAAFKGPDYSYDETHYLSNDGDHPNAAGHEKIASSTETVIENALHV